MAREDNERVRPRDRIRGRAQKVGSPLDVLAQAQAALTGAETPAGENYNYSDPGRFGDPRYSYQVGDEMTAPGPEPPRDDPRWNDWKKHAAAWRNFIGGRQQYVNNMIGTGYSPEDLGIFNRKEEGQAGYRRLTQNNNSEINRLRQVSEQYMRGTDAEVDPITGLYMTGGPGNSRYYDARGMGVNAQGQRTGGFYGMGNTMGQYGFGAIPRMGQATAGSPLVRPTGGRMATPAPAPAPVMPRPAYSPVTTAGWGGRFGAGTTRPRRMNPYGL